MDIIYGRPHEFFPKSDEENYELDNLDYTDGFFPRRDYDSYDVEEYEEEYEEEYQDSVIRRIFSIITNPY